jgi:Quercetinase C-terminal cupin domain
MQLHQDARYQWGVLKRGQRLRLSLFTESMHDCGWLAARLHYTTMSLSAGDGAGADDTSALRLEAHDASEILLFDLV